MCDPPISDVPLPSRWAKSVRSSVLHVISLAHFAIVTTRGWAANALNPRARQAAESERLTNDAALLRKELRIKDSRITKIDPRRRPHYPATERMAILQLKAARGWSLAQFHCCGCQTALLGLVQVVMETSGADVLDWIIGVPGQVTPCMVAWRSRVVMIGGRAEMRYSFLRAGGNQLAILHTQHFRQEDLEQVLRLIQGGLVRIRPLIRDVVPVARAPRICDTLAREPSRLLGTVFDWT